MSKSISLGELFTPAELLRAQKLFAECESGEFNKRCTAEIVEPVLDRINKVTGQENDARYWAYALEYAISEAGGH